MNLDFGFFNWDLVQSFILKGLIFSVQLTLVAMIGGIVLGTMLALMRLSGKPWLVMPAAAYVNTLRSIPLVMVILWFFLLIPLARLVPAGSESAGDLGDDHLHGVRGGLLLGDHARRHPVGAQGPGLRRLRGRHDLRAVHEADRPAAGLPQHAAGAADADHHPVPGHLAGLRDRRLRPAQGLRGRRQELQPPGRDLPARRRRLLRHLLHACRCWCAGCRRRSPSFAEPEARCRHDRHQERLQVVRQLPGADRLHHRASRRARSWSSAARRARASRR